MVGACHLKIRHQGRNGNIMYIELLKLQIKRIIRKLPVMLAGAVLIGIVAFGIVSASIHSKSAGTISYDFSIGIAVNDSSLSTGMALNLLEANVDSDTLKIITGTEEDIYRHLKNGTIIAGIILPENVIDSVMSGENYPITVAFPDNCGLEALVFTEITDALTNILVSSQSAIYAAEDFCYKYSTVSVSKEINKKLNNMYIADALGRKKHFSITTINTTKSLPIMTYYGIAAIVLFMVFFVVNFQCLHEGVNKTFLRQIKGQGLNSFHLFTINTLGCMMALSIVTLPLGILLKLLARDIFYCNFFAFIIGIFLSNAITALYSGFIYTLLKNSRYTVILVSVLSLIFSFVGGVILPAAALPRPVAFIGSLTPAGIVFNLLCSIF